MDHIHTHLPTPPYVACVNEKTVLAQPRPIRVLRTQEVDVSALEQAATLMPANNSPGLEDTVTGGTHSVRDSAARMLFDVVLDRAMELCPPSTEMIPIQYHAVFDLRYHHGLDEVDDSFDLGLPDLPHLARASGHPGPLVPLTTQLEALLDKHTWDREDLPVGDVTQPSFDQVSLPIKQPAFDGNHKASMPLSSSSAFNSTDARKTNGMMHSSPGKYYTQVADKIRMRRTMAFRLPKMQNHTRESLKALRKRQRQSERDAKAFEHELHDEQAVEPALLPSKTHASVAPRGDEKYEIQNKSRANSTSFHGRSDAVPPTEPANQQEPATAAPTYFATIAESSTKQEPVSFLVRTPMGTFYPRDRTTEPISQRWGNAEIEDWCNSVQDGSVAAPNEIPVPERGHPELDAIIARGNDPFLLLYPEYADNEEAWAALSSLHEEDRSTSDESYSTAKEAKIGVIGVAESPISNDELESQDTNQAFFNPAMPVSHTQPLPVVVIVENGRTSLQSPIPDRTRSLTIGSLRI